MATRKLNFLLLFSALALVLACVPTIGAPMPTADPNQINIFIAETVQAAATQTSAAMPTFTPTETSTSTPANTLTPSPTYTATVIFILSTPTSLVFPTFTAVSSGSVSGGGSGTSTTSSENFACQIISVDPANGTSFNGRTDFDAVWRVKNIGQKVWDRTSVDYSYDSGAKMHKTDVYDLSANVKSGETTSIVADMITPKDAGSYTTYWVLHSSNKEFCKMSLTINVR
jgi:hypothetical protein